MITQNHEIRSTILFRWTGPFRVLIWSTAIFASLLTFPAGTSLMMAAWIGWVGFELFRPSGQWRAAWMPLLVCLMIVLIKQPGWSLALIVFLMLGFVIVVGWRWCLSRRVLLSFFSILCAALVWYSVVRWTDAHCSQRIKLVSDRPVVCLGDSLTDAGYPQVLASLLSIPVADFGRNGYTTDEAIQKLLPEIEALQPQAAIVELGGHDYKNGQSRAETERNLVTIIERLQAAGAQVILVEVPRGFISDQFTGLERELSGRYDLQLIPDTLIRRFVFFSPIVPPGSWLGKKSWLSEDGLHPNQRGNELFAEYAKAALVRIFGNDVLYNSP